ncbi:UNVERIFIED_CONTAM: hypothetical protein Sangu_2599700 [Sesamum angustifolium]|uniref:Secreted protein n=1 Tax=Sesamum angustifolium TaxID=2727405 RepID=A0AAW2J629_9LAMI
MVACCMRMTTLIWTTASFVETLGTSRQRNPNRKKTLYVVLRYLPLNPRLQRLCASEATAEQMTWYARKTKDPCAPSDAEALRHFDRRHLDFAAEPRNVRLGLCTDGFAPHGQSGCMYSCWPVILTPYNFPLEMCMSSEYMFLTMVIPGFRIRNVSSIFT